MPEADMYDSAVIELDESPLLKTSRSRRSGLHITQGRSWRDTSKRRWGSLWWIALVCLATLASPAAAVVLDFDNCLSKNILESVPLQLQFVPTNVSVEFNLTDPLHPLNVTVYGNVSGTVSRTADYPAPDSSDWTNPNWTDGKIEDISTSNNKYSTIFTELNVLSFTPFNNASRFRDLVTQGTFPLAPVFNYNL
jgi:hypothetical protein